MYCDDTEGRDLMLFLQLSQFHHLHCYLYSDLSHLIITDISELY